MITPTVREKVEALLDLGTASRAENVQLTRWLYYCDKKLGLYGPELEVLDQLYNDRIAPKEQK